MDRQVFQDTFSKLHASEERIQEVLSMSETMNAHPRGRRITFVDSFEECSCRRYTFEELPAKVETVNSRHAYVGAERIRDIVNDYDPITYRLPYEFENRWFHLTYAPGEGVTGFVNKATGRDLLGQGAAPFFTPPVKPKPSHSAYSILCNLSRQ